MPINCTTYYFRIADFLFSVQLPEASDIEKLLPSFRPFRETENTDGQILFNFSALPPDIVAGRNDFPGFAPCSG